jgi:hypothetical protein
VRPGVRLKNRIKAIRLLEIGTNAGRTRGQGEQSTYGSKDIVIDSRHPIGALEGNSTRCNEEILILGRMTLELWARGRKESKGDAGVDA